MTTLDALVAEHAPDASSAIIKIDVEGFEPQVLDGAKGLFDRLAWWRAIIEYNPTAIAAAGGDPRAWWRTLSERPGCVITTSTARSLAGDPRCLFDLDDTWQLPTDAPGEVDVLVGAGTVGD
jgi:hypothetical protein